MKRTTILTALLFILNLGLVYSQVGITEDGSIPEASAILDVKSTTKGMLFPRMTEVQRNAIDTPATGLMIYQTDETAGLYYYNGTAWLAISAANDDSTTHYAGELYGGGVIFWVDHSGQHGLIVSITDLHSGKSWSNITNQAVNTSYWDGASNTTAIIGQSGHTSSAAKICDDYTNGDYGTGIYSDWYLPSITEFILIWKNLYIVQKALYNDEPIRHNYYWSSSEKSTTKAWAMEGDGMQNYSNKSSIHKVRAIRAF